MDPSLITADISNGVGCPGRPRTCRVRWHASCAWSGNAGAGSLAPEGLRSGLGGPMPVTITLVVTGRCRPTPDRMLLGASPDRDARGIVTGRPAVLGGEGFLPVLRATHRGVRRIDGNNRDAGRVSHRRQPGAELSGRHTGDDLPEPPAAAVFLAGLLGGEVEVLDGDGLDAARPGPVQQTGQGVADLRVAMISGPAEVVEEATGLPDRVAVNVEAPGGEVIGVGVDTDHSLGEGCGQGNVRVTGKVQAAVRYQHPRAVSWWMR